MFEQVQNWVKELKRILGDKVILAIVGNKIDLDRDRNVPVEEAEEYDLILLMVIMKGFTFFFSFFLDILELLVPLTFRLLPKLTRELKNYFWRLPSSFLRQ